MKLFWTEPCLENLSPNKWVCLSRDRHNLASGSNLLYLETMEITLSPETERRLHALAAQSGGATVEGLVREVIEEYLGDLAKVRETLDRRYDDLESGRVRPIPGDEVIDRLRAKRAAYRAMRDERPRFPPH